MIYSIAILFINIKKNKYFAICLFKINKFKTNNNLIAFLHSYLMSFIMQTRRKAQSIAKQHNTVRKLFYSQTNNFKILSKR